MVVLLPYSKMPLVYFFRSLPPKELTLACRFSAIMPSIRVWKYTIITISLEPKLIVNFTCRVRIKWEFSIKKKEKRLKLILAYGAPNLQRLWHWKKTNERIRAEISRDVYDDGTNYSYSTRGHQTVRNAGCLLASSLFQIEYRNTPRAQNQRKKK